MIYLMKNALLSQLLSDNIAKINDGNKVDIEEKTLVEIFFDRSPNLEYTNYKLGGCTIVTCDAIGDRILTDSDIVAFEFPFFSAREPEPECDCPYCQPINKGDEHWGTYGYE